MDVGGVLMIKFRMKDPVSGLTHAFGAGLSVAALVLLLEKTLRLGASGWHIASFAVFGAGMVLLYSASATYHLLNLRAQTMRLLRKLDHIMIFVLIAATYTPICLIALRGPWGWALFGAVWGLAALGIVFKAIWFDAPRWLYTLCYVLLGWACLACVVPLVRAMPADALIWLAGGGVAYTLGAVGYALKWPGRNNRWFGFHEVFHIYILAGTLCHFVMMYRYLAVMA